MDSKKTVKFNDKHGMAVLRCEGKTLAVVLYDRDESRDSIKRRLVDDAKVVAANMPKR